MASSLWAKLPLGRGNKRRAWHRGLLTPHPLTEIYSGWQDSVAGALHRTRKSRYISAGQRRKPPLSVRANEIRKGLIRKIPRVCRQSWTHTRAHTHTHTETTDKGGGEGERGFQAGGHNENGQGTAGSLTCAGQWAGKLSQQRECTQKRLGMQLRLQTNG